MAVAAGAALLLALILAFFLIRRKKKKKRGDQRWKNRLRNVRNRCRNRSLPTYRALAVGKNSRTLSASPAWIVMRKTGCSLCCATVWAVWRRADDRCGNCLPVGGDLSLGR
ncbi:MAG: hypothetical protein ACLS8R_10005 [Anaeromassilibacillus sp.]